MGETQVLAQAAELGASLRELASGFCTVVAEALGESQWEIDASDFQLEVCRLAPEGDMLCLVDFTGNPLGYYVFAVDGRRLRAALGLGTADDPLGDECEELVKEALSSAAGAAMSQLPTHSSTTTLLAPRAIYGMVSFPKHVCLGVKISTPAGVAEFYVALESMRTDMVRLANNLQSQTSRLQSELLAGAHAHAQLAWLASTDELTGLANRRSFMEAAERVFEASVDAKREFSVLLLDIDFFKRINDTYGHAMGDEALRHIGRVLSESLRGADFAGRIGGEEFAVCMPATSLEHAVQVAERLRVQIEKIRLMSDNGSRIPLTTSIGAATRIVQDTTLAQQINRADVALYQAKHSGRNRLVAA